ncbi:MAG TPA: cupredoxin family copper-binding protein [Candidatus Angelobacter sp.]|nr:cupredoxin family copper-binding protein [Candidatus Angelobacter sp.]
MKRVWRIAGVVAALVIGSALAVGLQIPLAKTPGGVHAGGGAAVSAAEVKIDNFTFAPAMLTVAVGTQVTWINRDDIPHTVVSEDQAIKSKALDTDDKFTFTFTKAGTYTYFCSLHPKMKGKVVVE